jgi:hypothetical protein
VVSVILHIDNMSAVRFVASKTPTGSCWMFHLNCHVKTHVNSQRGGIVSIKDSVIELNIAAPPRDGEANKAVRELIANVSTTDLAVVQSMSFQCSKATGTGGAKVGYRSHERTKV